MTVEQRATGHSWPRHFVAATCSSLLRGETLTWREREEEEEEEEESSRWLFRLSLGIQESRSNEITVAVVQRPAETIQASHLCTRRTVPNNYVLCLRFPSVLEVSTYTYTFRFGLTRSVRRLHAEVCYSPRICAR